jgi:hypothetical protein
MIFFLLRQVFSLRGTTAIPPGLSVCQASAGHHPSEEHVRACIGAGISGIGLAWDKVASFGARKARAVLRSYDMPAVSLVGVPSLNLFGPGAGIIQLPQFVQPSTTVPNSGLPLWV